MMRGRLARARLDGASAFTRAWVWLYTAPLLSAVREARRAEIASDLWEQTHSANGGGDAPALDIVRRCVGGMPADVIWCVTAARRARRSSTNRRTGRFVMTMSRADGVFTALAMLSLVWIALFTGLATTTGEDVSAWWGFLGLGAVLIGAGLWVERDRPALGETLILAPTVAMAVITVWSVLSPILAALLLLAWAGRRGFFRR